MASTQSKITEKVMHLLNYKEKLTKALKEAPYHSDKSLPQKRMFKTLDIKTKGEQNQQIFILKPKEDLSDLVIFYLHGGAYLHGFQNIHWTFIHQLIKETKATIIAPDYPLIPNSFIDAYDFLIPIYQDILKTYPKHKIIIMGDSAGGGLALGLNQVIKDQKMRLPHHTVLLSPWLDVTCQDPLIDDIKDKDPILNKEALIKAGLLYAKDHDLKDPRLSPLYGDLKGLSPISLFAGSHDLLYLDALALIKKAQTHHLDVTPYLYEDMMHVWMFFGLPESKKVFQEIIDIFNLLK